MKASLALVAHFMMISPTCFHFSSLVSLSSAMIAAIFWNSSFAFSSAGVTNLANVTWMPSQATLVSRCADTRSICAFRVFSFSVVPYLSAHFCCSFRPSAPSANSGRIVAYPRPSSCWADAWRFAPPSALPKESASLGRKESRSLDPLSTSLWLRPRRVKGTMADSAAPPPSRMAWPASTTRRERVVKLMVRALASMSRDLATDAQRLPSLTVNPRLRFSPAVVLARSWVVVTAVLAWAMET